MDDLHDEYGGCDLPSLMSSKGSMPSAREPGVKLTHSEVRQSRTEECLSKDIGRRDYGTWRTIGVCKNYKNRVG